jgi:glycosyltransferase involved in cell wall biosynthesis
MTTSPVTVVITCYNLGAYIQDAVSSVEQCPQGLCDIIVVDDGSTDQDTINILETLEKRGHRIIRQENSGIAAARNAGISVAKSEYILPLDADDKVEPRALEKAVDLMRRRPDAGVVYGDARCFGESAKLMKARRMFQPLNLAAPCLYYCSLFRWRVWQELGGYDPDRKIMGVEDWEFWIRVAKSNWHLVQMHEILFYYRVRQGSMVEAVIRRRNEMMQYIVRKHADLYAAEYLRYADMTNVADYMKRWPFEFAARLVTQVFLPKIKDYYRRLRGERAWMNKS